MIRVPFGPCDIKVSRKGRKPCWSEDSVVNCMLRFKEFRWVRNCCVCSDLWITNVSPSNLSHILGGLDEELKALVSKYSMKMWLPLDLEGIPW